MTLPPRRYCLVFMCFLWLAGTGNASLLDWIWGTKMQEEHVDSLNTEQDSTYKYDLLQIIPYEGKAEDKKFVEDAKKYTVTSQSELDNCHREVIAEIKTVCLTATEEDLSKLSVNLLNCHSEHSGKGLFPCTEKMTLLECTQHMDTEMWLTYHVMNLKTRAMCYAARQLTQHDLSQGKVNNLAEAMQHQILTMLSVKDKQGDLETITYGTKNIVSKAQDELQLHVDKLNVVQEDMEKLFGLKIADLVKMKISTDEKRRHYLKYKKNVEKNLESIIEKLKKQADGREEDYSEMVATMETINEMVNSTLEIMGCRIIMLHDRVEQLIVEREGVVEVLSNMSTAFEDVEGLWQHIDSRFEKTYEHLGMKGNRLELFKSTISHVLVLLGSMIFCTLFGDGFFSYAFTLFIYKNLLVMYFCEVLPTLEPHVLFVVFAFLSAVQWFVAGVHSFLQYNDDEVSNVYMLDNDAFVSVPGEKGFISSTKDSAACLIDKLWRWLQTFFKKTELIDEVDNYDDGVQEEDIVISDEDSLDELEGSIFFNDDYIPSKHGSSLSRSFSPLGGQLSSPFGRHRTLEPDFIHSRRTPTPLRQFSDSATAQYHNASRCPMWSCVMIPSWDPRQPGSKDFLHSVLSTVVYFQPDGSKQGANYSLKVLSILPLFVVICFKI